ncbi:hypothetical protein D3C86_1666440 [compost metagenome]
MDDLDVKRVGARCTFQGHVQASGSIFTEHQVLTVGQSEGLFVGPLYCGLYGSAERSFYLIDDRDQRQFVQMRAQTNAQFRRAALAMGCRNDTFGRAKPCQNLGVLQCLVGEVINELLLNQLTGKRRRTWAGRGIGHVDF